MHALTHQRQLSGAQLRVVRMVVAPASHNPEHQRVQRQRVYDDECPHGPAVQYSALSLQPSQQLPKERNSLAHASTSGLVWGASSSLSRSHRHALRNLSKLFILSRWWPASHLTDWYTTIAWAGVNITTHRLPVNIWPTSYKTRSVGLSWRLRCVRSLSWKSVKGFSCSSYSLE